MADRDVVVLGVDPGTRITGWGVVAEVSGQARLLGAGTLRPDPKAEMCWRLGELFEGVAGLIRAHGPAEAAIEEVFAAKNASSALKLGQARGAIMAACAVNGVVVQGYAPGEIKKSLVGGGRAEKSQVAFMVGQVLGCKADWALDASDALAAAICHLNMRRFSRLAGLR